MTLARLLRALKNFMPASGRWALLTEEATLLYHTATYVTDRQDFQNVMRELLPYLEILSGDILLVKGTPLLAHEGEAALVMFFPKSVAGQNLFFVERITLDAFGTQANPFPPLYLSRNFADEGDLLADLQEMLPAPSADALGASFHHLLWIQLKILDLFAAGFFKKISGAEVRKFWQQHKDYLIPYYDEILDQLIVHQKPWAPGRAVHLQLQKKQNLLAFDFSKTQWPKEWLVTGDLLKDLVPQVLRQHLYPDLPGSDAENDFVKVTLPQTGEREMGSRPLPPAIVAPLICDFLSESLYLLFAESGWAASASGPLHFQLEFSSGTTFGHLLFGGGGAQPHSHGEAGHNPWLPGFETLSIQKSLAPMPLEILKLGKRQGSGGKGLSRGGDGLEWIFKLKEPARITAYTFQGLWPARGLKTQNSGKKAQILRGDDDILGKKIQIKQELAQGDTLTLRTGGGAGIG